ncbi:probable potassium transporter 13 [Mangifera indica]|uniref:probable potassium transporter 13 n=1 Tax=Mangifera indica TaxID=29780 RepID=UPI001CF9DB28|nr:probable potassium transporter 13 [Mangifera indica]
MWRFSYQSTFSGKLRLHEEDHVILRVLSLVFCTLTLIPLCKYIITVLGADDNGEGGTFALYSLLCRHAKLGLSSAPHATADEYSPYTSETPLKGMSGSLLVKEFFDKHHNSRVLLLLVVLLGIIMVIGDGIPTPSISGQREIKPNGAVNKAYLPQD